MVQRKSKKKQQNQRRLPIKKEKRLNEKSGNVEDGLLIQRKQTDAKNINKETKDWMDLNDTEEWKQYEIEEKKNKDTIQTDTEEAKEKEKRR